MCIDLGGDMAEARSLWFEEHGRIVSYTYRCMTSLLMNSPPTIIEDKGLVQQLFVAVEFGMIALIKDIFFKKSAEEASERGKMKQDAISRSDLMRSIKDLQVFFSRNIWLLSSSFFLGGGNDNPVLSNICKHCHF